MSLPSHTGKEELALLMIKRKFLKLHLTLDLHPDSVGVLQLQLSHANTTSVAHKESFISQVLHQGVDSVVRLLVEEIWVRHPQVTDKWEIKKMLIKFTSLPQNCRIQKKTLPSFWFSFRPLNPIIFPDKSNTDL